MFFEDIYLPRPSDYDRKGKLSYEAIFQILETAASNHSTNAGDSIADANKNGIAWILTEWRVKIHHIPENGQQLNIKTWVRGKAPASMLYRDFEVVDDSDNTLLTAEAKFALLDLNTMRITRISEELFAAYCPEDKIVFEGTSRLRAPSEFSAQYDLALRRSDIDFNGHVHNTKYVDFALQALHEQALNDKSVEEIQVVYSKPVLENDNVCLKYVQNEHEHYVCVTVNDVPYATIRICTAELV